MLPLRLSIRAFAQRLAAPSVRSTRLLLLPFLLLLPVLPAAPASAAPRIWLPTPAGETWKIIQGYGCGTHDSWDHYSLDLVNADGRTRGAPVRAAADGTIWSWTGKSGTLILAHGDGFYTMYTHMDSVVTTARGRFVARGTVIGTAGNRAAGGTPHLHFTAFMGKGLAAQPRQSIPLAFAEGYDLPEVGGCNQHGGRTLTAGGQRAAPEVQFSTGAEQGRWYNADQRLEFVATAGHGFSQGWDADPAGGAPVFAGADAGYVQLAWAGEGLHTLYVRAWGADGQQRLATYGPVGYDVTAPDGPAPIAPIEVAPGTPALLRWEAARDGGSGVSGYRVYIGPDQGGTSDWFTPEPQVHAPPLAPGGYLLRVQALDYAGNAGPWATIGTVFSR